MCPKQSSPSNFTEVFSLKADCVDRSEINYFLLQRKEAKDPQKASPEQLRGYRRRRSATSKELPETQESKNYIFSEYTGKELLSFE